MAEESGAAQEQDRRTALRVGVAAASIAGATLLIPLLANGDASPSSPVANAAPTAATPAPEAQGAPGPATRSSGSGCGGGKTAENSSAAPAPPQAQTMAANPMARSSGS
ncbi:hypothetical protein REH65_00015 [Saccharopolyspora sp. ID03-671]|uniref:hypothetical protein n=1 Tax=Saccharopolyspora sp. ID03-671 TaxID=3073066 RepID=UPI003253D2CE